MKTKRNKKKHNKKPEGSPRQNQQQEQQQMPILSRNKRKAVKSEISERPC